MQVCLAYVDAQREYALRDVDGDGLLEYAQQFESDLEKVERVTCEVAAEVMREVPGGVPTFVPFIRYHTFGESGIELTVIMRGETFVDQFPIKHEFIKRLHDRFAREGIVIPYPIRALNYDQEKKG